MSKPRRDEFRVLVHSPADLNADYLAWAEYIQSTEGMAWGVPAIDERVIPIRDGEMGIIIGRPGHGKTSILMYLARTEAQRIMERGKRDKECVAYVTWEESAEDVTRMLLGTPDAPYTATDLAWGRVDLDVIRKQVVKQSRFPPVYVIGHGIMRARRGKRAPLMDPDAVLIALETMQEDYGVKPTLMCFDYIQRIPMRHESRKVEEVTEAAKAINDLAKRIACPAYVGAQARRDVDDRQDKVPLARDCQWASALEQDADKLFAVMRPVKYDDIKLLKVGGQRYESNDKLLVLKMLKQRGDIGDYTWALHFDPATLHLGLAATTDQEPEERVPF
jgi:replicative DNA helicase